MIFPNTLSFLFVKGIVAHGAVGQTAGRLFVVPIWSTVVVPGWGGCLSPLGRLSRSSHPACTAPIRSRRSVTPLSRALTAWSVAVPHTGQGRHLHIFEDLPAKSGHLGSNRGPSDPEPRRQPTKLLGPLHTHTHTHTQKLVYSCWEAYGEGACPTFGRPVVPVIPTIPHPHAHADESLL